jgi:lipopolysaccharide/colanic/teichoic acid biosynthesis glycosyltransferase
MLDLKVDSSPRTQPSVIREEFILPQDLFIRMLCTERRRSYRSGRRFVLMLLDPGRLIKSARRGELMANVLQAVAQSVRDTDLKGWYEDGSIIGVIFTELGSAENKAVVQALSNKVSSALYEHLSVEHTNEIRLSFHTFPEDWEDSDPTGSPASSSLKVVLANDTNRQKSSMHLKRLLDITGSIALMTLLFPVFLAIAIAVKLTSKGPVLFRQTRLGQDGKKFTFLKFRSMYANNDSSIHEQYVKRFMAGEGNDSAHVNGNQNVYKLTADPRITPIGRFIRKTSLDELPQFWNVLRGEMSLVGPRPPVMYEYEGYSPWHRQRLAAVKPGITGLWQVDGRSRVKFDDMVRLDIRYARSRSFWLDLKILINTPRAVISGNGAC